MSSIVFSYNQRVGSKKLAITECSEDPLKCYTWSVNCTKPIRKRDGVQVVCYGCTGCTALRLKWKKQELLIDNHPLPIRKADGTTNIWIDEKPSYEHFCEAKKRSEVCGLAVRRSMPAELAKGTCENTASALVRTEMKLLVKNSGQSREYQAEARHAGVSNRSAVSQSFSRAKTKNYPRIADFQNVMDDENFLLRCTARGSIEGHEKFGEQLLLFGNDDMLIFCSPRQLFFLSKSKQIISDGNYKYKPVGAYEVYRVFGFVKKNPFDSSCRGIPEAKGQENFSKDVEGEQVLFFALVATTENLFLVARALDGYGNKLETAHFDHEIAAHGSFKKQFPDVSIKMCSFHVKQDLNLQVQNKGLAVEYRDNGEVQNVVRMLGAIQLMPTEVWNHSIAVIRQYIQENFNLLEGTVPKLNQLVEYYGKTWLSLGEFFSLHGVSGPRTTNAAESYHGKLHNHFRTKCPLGEWIVTFKELQHAEESNASDVNHSRQDPRPQSQASAALSVQIAEAQQQLQQVLETQAVDDAFDEKLVAYLLHIGYLMGYNNRPAPIVDENMEVEPAVVEMIDEEEEALRALEGIEDMEYNLY